MCALLTEGMPPSEVARRFGVKYNAVRMARRRHEIESGQFVRRFERGRPRKAA